MTDFVPQTDAEAGFDLAERLQGITPGSRLLRVFRDEKRRCFIVWVCWAVVDEVVRFDTLCYEYSVERVRERLIECVAIAYSWEVGLLVRSEAGVDALRHL